VLAALHESIGRGEHGRHMQTLGLAAPELLADKAFVREACRACGDALYYASAELRADKEVVLEAVRQDGSALKYASPDLQGERDVVLLAMETSGRAWRFGCGGLTRGDRRVAAAALRHNGMLLREVRGAHVQCVQCGARSAAVRALVRDTAPNSSTSRA